MLTAEKVESRIRHDSSGFAAFLLPMEFELEFPDHYVYLWDTVIQKLIHLRDGVDRLARYALGLPRGFIKTTFLKILVCYIILYDLNDYVLVICDTEPLVKDFIRDVDEMLGSENVKNVYLDWKACKITDNKQIKEAVIKDKRVIIQGIGAMTSIRGVNKFHKRPGIVIFDDAQSRENAMSEEARKNLEYWLFATLMKAVRRKGVMFLWIGNMYNSECVLYKLKKNPLWVSLITGSILSDGTSLWPELKSVEVILEEWKHDSSVGKGDVFIAECQNIVEDDGVCGFLKNARFEVKYVQDWELEEAQGGFIIIDPSNDKPQSDANGVGVFKVLNDIPHMIHLHLENMNPEEVIKYSLTQALKYKISCIAIEGVAYQASLKFWMDKYIKKYYLNGINVVLVNPKSRNKKARITTWLKALFAKHSEICDIDALSKVEWQARHFRLDRTKNIDEALDIGAYSQDVLLDHRQFWMNRLDPTNIVPEEAFIEFANEADERIGWAA